MRNRPWLHHYDSGVPHQLTYPSMTVHKMFEEMVGKYPDHSCTIFRGASITYREMDTLSDQLAAGLAALGVKKGDRVGLLMPNIPQFVMAYLGILKAGGVVVATNPLYVKKEIEYQVNDAGIEIMIVINSHYALMKDIQPGTKVRTLIVTNMLGELHSDIQISPEDISLETLISHWESSQRPTLEILPEDVALFQYSGGTTGISKGAIALHRNLITNTIQFCHWMTSAQEGTEIVLMAIPLFHVYGMVLGMLVGFRMGATLVMVPNARDMPELLGSLQHYKATIFPGVPTLFNAINRYMDTAHRQYELNTLKICISGSSPLMRETKEIFEAFSGGKLVEGYGLSEAPTATHCNPILGENRSGSIGLPLPDVDARIISLEDGRTVLQPGEIGELIIQSPQVMQGYHNMPSETEQAIQDGWLYTGDIARMDDDGYFYIVDRKKDLIKPGGFQVWPREVEEVILIHPKVQEAAVAGVPDAFRGETVKAWVVLKPGEYCSEEDIRRFCKQEMAPFKVPTLIEFRNELPKSTVGKILRRELVRQHMELNSL
jgi:long-chain acyl-CoA synthetase